MFTKSHKKWKNLSPRTRKLTVAAAVVDGGLKAAALHDLSQRSAREVRGNKRVWAIALALVNSLGVLPIVYFVHGRRSGDAH